MKKPTYHIRNWSEYNASLKQRGSGAIWVSPEAVENWRTDAMNPHWALTAFTVMKRARRCPHCRKRAIYPRKRPGQFHVCKFCKRKFKEKGE